MAKSEMPFMDVQKMLEQFKMPGVDFSALVEARRKDVEALMAANRQAFEGMQLLAKRQSEMLAEAMAEWQAAMKSSMNAQQPDDLASRQAELGKHALERALANMRELAEMATKSQTQAWDVVNRRFHESLEELKQVTKAK